MRVLMLFLDGVGIGRRDPAVNPFFAARLPALRSLLGDQLPSLRRRALEGKSAAIIPIDATLGVAGLPQSGTGQTALFTGQNGARTIGKHFGPYLYSTLRPVVERYNILRLARDGGKRVCFANAFPPRFFEYLSRHPGRAPVTAFSCMTAGIPLRKGEDLLSGTALSADITGEGWHALGHCEIPVIDPEEGGRRLVHLLEEHDLVLFEYWQTDRAGHAQDLSAAVKILERFDRLLGGILGGLDHRRAVMVLSSDHGNIEDLSTKSHTRNPVPALIAGHGHAEIARRLANVRNGRPDLTSIAPLVLRLLGVSPQQ